MNFKTPIGIAMMMIFGVSAHAAPVPAEKPLTHLMAGATANTLNRLETVEGFTKWISNRVPEKDMKKFKANLPKMGLKMSDKFPKVTHDKNKVIFSKDQFFIYNKNSITYQGQEFAVSDKSYDQLVSEIFSAINKPGKSANLFFPAAHAQLSDMGQKGLLGMALGAGVGLFAGPAFFGSSAADGAVVGAVVGGAGGLFLGSDLNFFGGGQVGGGQGGGQITCRNGMYQVCHPSNNMFGNQQNCQIVSPQVAYQISGGYPPPCGPQTLPGFVGGVNNWNQPYYPNNHMGPPAGAVPVR